MKANMKNNQDKVFKHIYGPVPSRRLGRSLGVDLVPFKVCTYDCVYCQLGRTTNKTVERGAYVDVGEVLEELGRKLAEGDTPDYISLAGSGEPTLNLGLGELIAGIKKMTEIPVAVLTNGSLLWRKDVQDELMAADLVLPSLDAGDRQLFEHVNRPHPGIGFEQMVEGLVTFTKRFPGEVWLEVMLLAGMTGISADVKRIAELVQRINPARTQLNTVCRPPAEDFAFPLPPERMCSLAKLFPGKVEIIAETSSAQADSLRGAHDEELLALLCRRPCTPSGVAQGLGIHLTEAIKHLEALLAAGKLEKVFVEGNLFYQPKGGSR